MNSVSHTLEDFVISLSEHIRPVDSARSQLDAGEVLDENAFNVLAIALFALQFTHNPPYRTFCESRRMLPWKTRHWNDIPAVPAAAFKEFDLSCIPAAERSTVFHSSSTTEHRPSRHFHNGKSLALYEKSLLTWFPVHFPLELPSLCQGIALTPPPVQVPHSSLVHMFETLRRHLNFASFKFTGQTSPENAWDLDYPATITALRQAIDVNKPVLLLGTAFSYVHLLDGLAQKEVTLRLPPGSHALETGGYKGRSRSLPKSELHSLISHKLGIPLSGIICEYGMSELSSQAYDRLEMHDDAQLQAWTPESTRCFHFPPWARAQIVSPETGREIQQGETGLIRVFDLANVYSVMAIQTEDLAVRRSNGFEVIGRAALAEPRGCSLLPR